RDQERVGARALRGRQKRRDAGCDRVLSVVANTRVEDDRGALLDLQLPGVFTSAADAGVKSETGSWLAGSDLREIDRADIADGRRLPDQERAIGGRTRISA